MESDKNTRKHHIQESEEASPFPASDHRAARNRQETDIKKKRIHKRSSPPYGHMSAHINE